MVSSSMQVVLNVLIGIGCLSIVNVEAFSPMLVEKSSSTTALFGAFNKGNKQADLMSKMAAAKKQRQQSDGTNEPEEEPDLSPGKKRILSDLEMKKQNDMKRFEQLLDAEASTVNYKIGGGNYKTKSQEDEEVDAGVKGVDRLFEGDPAPTEPFENLINFVTGKPLGKNGASRILPWLHTSVAKQDEILVVVSDPRAKSSELRAALKNIAKLVPAAILSKMIVINADSSGENRKFLKKNDIENMNIYTDEKREWMKEYTVLGEDRWSMCMMVLKNGRVDKLVRELDVELATQVIKSAAN